MYQRLEKLGFSNASINTGKVDINYVVGPNNGPALVLIPGQALSWESYLPSLPALSEKFTVYALDVRGHGKSGWTPGEYNFPNMGKDVVFILENVVKRPAIISGNSSGGLIALWVAANAPNTVSGIILEDTPVFSAEWPRLKDDCWVYRVFKKSSATIGNPHGRDLASFFKGMEVPIEGSEKVIAFPNWISSILAGVVAVYQKINPDKPIDLPFLPAETRLLVKCLSIYDPSFTRSFVDGSACVGFSHEEALRKIQCPVMLLHANWFRHPEYGLVGSMDDQDVARFKSLVPNVQYKRIQSGHMIHFENPKEYVSAVKSFASTL